MTAIRHILLFRFSALGDVAMTVPVIKLLLAQYPDLEVTIVSNPFMEPLFYGIDRLHFYGADTKKEFKGLRGLYRLSMQLKKSIPFDAVADLHDVVRTKAIRFFLGTKPMAVIDKGRSEKKELTRPVNKKLRPLKTTFERYADVFNDLGLPVKLDIAGGVQHRAMIGENPDWIKSDKTLIGVAPFAKHTAKMYPLEKMKQVVMQLGADESNIILLFGSKSEAEILNAWTSLASNIFSLAGKYSFGQELVLIDQLDLMITMDSANMHLASLHGVPVVSIWGGTHPWLGFYGWGQPLENAVQLDLPCRPSSVFGNKDCPVHSKEGCMEGIEPKMIVERAKAIISFSSNLKLKS